MWRKNVRFFLIFTWLTLLLAACQPADLSEATPAQLAADRAEQKTKKSGDILRTQPLVDIEPALPSEQDAVAPKPETQTVEKDDEANESDQDAPSEPTPSTSHSRENTPSSEERAEPPLVSAPEQKASEPDPQPEASEQKQTTVSLTIQGVDASILSAHEVAIDEGDTVLDILITQAKEERIPIEYEGAGPFAYVQGIQNVYEFDHGPQSGWIYRVNGKLASKSAGAYEVREGDVIEWVYTTVLPDPSS
ncbi:DUF4430 domain-containing protein [Bacillaceae bacterium SIJ1]|uniref:DUF4430 domain-containing protein n=1 Tax=Litoribacterium kuwaitense TaxID=1398745 RepID=UPI0013E9C7DC|nr:DUF4430 domain-containing protein [Litoribacterium kuwaitense]NGP44473.1 DUF4430 domain-containing protein [Litoribacterium kuwaitense]